MTENARARDTRYGRRGGRWMSQNDPALFEGAYGIVDGAKGRCPTPIHVRCFCGYFWVVPSMAAKPCDRCGEPFITVEPRSA